jgi:hypothetical protein
VTATQLAIEQPTKRRYLFIESHPASDRATDNAASSLHRKQAGDRRIEVDVNRLSHSFNSAKVTSRPTEQATKRLINKAASSLDRKRQTKRQSSLLSLTKAADNSREMMAKQQTHRGFFSPVKVACRLREQSTICREEGDEV